jgi:hypothetical protein
MNRRVSVVAAVLLVTLVAGCSGSPHGQDSGVAECQHFGDALKQKPARSSGLPTVDPAALHAAAAAFDGSKFDDIRSAGDAVIADIQGNDSVDFDGDLIQLWAACDRH